MQEVVFDVEGSASDPYRVVFVKRENGLSAFCSCPAGENGKHCKHRISILMGDDSAITSDNREQAALVQEWFSGSELEECVVEVRRLDGELASLKKELTAVKKRMARIMRA